MYDYLALVWTVKDFFDLVGGAGFLINLYTIIRETLKCAACTVSRLAVGKKEKLTILQFCHWLCYSLNSLHGACCY